MTLKQKVINTLEATKKGVFILATSLVVLIAVRNSLQWHLEQFWGASRTFFSDSWAYIYREWGQENDIVMYIGGTNIVGFLAYFFANIFFVFLDLTGRPAVLHKYKIQETKNCPVNIERYKESLKLISFNAFITAPLFLIITCPFTLWWGIDMSCQLPSFPQVIAQLLFYAIMVEIIFYYVHRLFHHRLFYQRFHKKHHEWTAPISVASIYCHPLEHLLSNLFSVLGGPILLGSCFHNHLATAWLWVVIATVNTTISHCGYHLPFLSSPEGHDFHHSRFNQNFGVLGILDRLHGTDEQFLKSIDHKRHFILLSLHSAKELVPNEMKKNQ